jgi:hypothetical protein
MDIEKLVADPQLEKEGKWFVYDADEGVEFKLGYIGSKSYNRKLTRLLFAARRGRQGGNIPAGKQEEVQIESMIGTILLDWKGLDANGQPFVFSEANAKELLTRSIEVRAFIQNEAGVLSNFQQQPESESDPDDLTEAAQQGKTEELPADKAELKSGVGVGVGVG